GAGPDRAVDDDRLSRAPVRDEVADDLLQLVGVDDADEGEVTRGGDVGDVNGRLGARLRQLVDRFGPQVVHPHAVAGADEVVGHRTTHVAESDITDRRTPHGRIPRRHHASTAVAISVYGTAYSQPITRAHGRAI